jgi:phosphatidylinositol-3-phosphatase
MSATAKQPRCTAERLDRPLRPLGARARGFGICALAASILLGVGCAAAHPGSPLALGSPTQLPRAHRSHVVVIVMENAEYGEVIGNPAAPYVNALARRYGLATQSYAITHPSLPNYLALTGGSTHGVTSDCTECHVSAVNIVDQLEAAGISWGAYLEDLPRPCFGGAGAGGYAKKHNPFAYYDDIARSPARCGKLVGFARLADGLRSGRLPTYVWISPNLCDDGHDCGVATGDRFLARTVPALLHELGPHGFLVITWDEGGSDRGCCGAAHGGHIATILAGPDVLSGARERGPVDHYGVLATIEEALGLPRLASANDPLAGRLTPLFRRPPQIVPGRTARAHR